MFGMRIACEHSKPQLWVQTQHLGVPRVEEEDRGYHVKEERMAEHQPRKAGEYERPMTGTSSSLTLIIGGIALLAVILIALLFLR
jgi:LPXTG-motif cell wall-anchored protein